jgi:hypothetical protein
MSETSISGGQSSVVERVINGDKEGNPAEAALILESVRFDLIATAVAIPFLPSSVSQDDVSQQLVAEVLTTALDGRTESACMITARLLAR